MTDILKRIGDKASEVVNTLKSIPPGESEKKGLEAIQDNVNSYSHATADTKPSVAPEGAPAEQDKVSPLSRYGSRPGEKRIDTRKMLKPLGSSVPSYDEGTDRVPEDQLAMVHKDEAVLPPDEAEKYRAEHAENKPTTETATAQPSTDTLSLKPYGKVMEEKAKQKASEMVNNPGAQTAASEGPTQESEGAAPKTEEKPKLTYGRVLAEDWLKHNGLNVDAMKAPKEFNQGTPEPAMGAPNPAGPLKPIVQPENPTNPTAAPTGKEAFRAQIKMYDAAYQSAMDRAAATNDPQYREQAGRIQEAKLAYEKAHPWGSPESAHPGVLGKIGHVAEMVASRAPGLAPIVATLPGSEMSRANEARGAREEVKEASAENTAENKATPPPGYKQVTGGAVDPKAVGTDMEDVPQVAFVNEKDPSKMVFAGPITPKTGAGGGDKATFQSTLAKVGGTDILDPKKIPAALEQAHKSGKINDAEYDKANAFIAANGNTPAMMSILNQAKDDQKIAAGYRGKVLVFQNPDGSRQGMTYEQAKAEGRDLNGAMTYTPMAADKLRTAEKSYHNALQMFTAYESDMGKANLNTDDQRGLQILTSHIDDAVSSDYVSKAASGFMDMLQGEPLTGYSKKAMGGVMTKDQYDKMSPAARALVADYFQAMLSHFQSIKDTQGSIPRNPEMIRTEMGAIPLPYLTKEEALPAFQKYFDRMHNMNVDAVRFGRAEPKAEEKTATAEGPKVGDQQTHNGATYVFDGKQYVKQKEQQ